MSDLFESNLVEDINIEDSIKGSYLDYSMSVIVGRALPDARDGIYLIVLHIKSLLVLLEML